MNTRQPAHVEQLSVYLDLEGNSHHLGTLAWKRDERRAYFEFHRDFLAAPLPVSPFYLPPAPNARPAQNRAFDGLHGLFSDSLPDGWGRKLLDRRLQAQGLDHPALTPLDRLAYVGSTGMGALRYVPTAMSGQHAAVGINLDLIADEAEAVQRELPTAEIELLLRAQGGSAGVRPKLMIGLHDDHRQVLADVGSGLPRGFSPWIVKFRAESESRQIGAEEYAYSLMARAAKVEMSETRIIETPKGRYFATRRFDRSTLGRHHVHTASGLLETSHQVAGIGYHALFQLTFKLTRDMTHVGQMFRRMAFNVLAHNRDDHARNHAFLMNSQGIWRPSPAYDLTFSSGPAGEHNLTILGEGRAPTRRHMLDLARKIGLPRGEAEAVIAEVADTVARWPEFADQAGLDRARMTEIRTVHARLAAL